MSNFTINSLEFEDIKANFITYLKSQNYFKNFDYNASGISTLLNVLAYNTHYIGTYTKMLLNESFVDSAMTRESLLSKAKLTGYIPKGKSCAVAEVKLKVKNIELIDEPPTRNVLVKRGVSFVSKTSFGDNRKFYAMDDVVLTTRTISTNTVAPFQELVTYESDLFPIYEGDYKTFRFVVDTTILNQRFIIQDKGIDINTLRVNVYTNKTSENFEPYFQAADVLEVKADSRVYYISANSDGNFEIFFGNGIFGKALDNANMIKIEYISTNGVKGNGGANFEFNKPEADPLTGNNVGNFDTIETTTLQSSNGGMDPESIDSLKFTIPNHFKQQKRIVTENDFKSIILSEFRNIETINLWGGEKHFVKSYGKIFVSLKPKNTDFISNRAKAEIKDKIINKWGMIGTDVVFIDPEYIDVDVDVFGKYDTSKTNRAKGEIESLIQASITDYNATYLNVFETMLSDVEMVNRARFVDSSIKTLFTNKVLHKKFTFNYNNKTTNSVVINNPILPGVVSTTFVYGGFDCILKDDAGLLYIYKSDGTKLLAKQFGSVDYTAGVINFILPGTAVMKEDDYGWGGRITFTATPRDPDINTNLNNIVRIGQIKVNLNV